jgi:hypothetical protein
MSAARQHTDGVKATGETTQIIKPVGRAEAALRAEGYRAPDCRPISHEDWVELESQLAYLRGESRPCRGCEGPLLPGQPDGAYCKRCAQELAELETDEYRSELFGLRSATCFVLGIAAGVFIAAVILKVAGWLL